LVKQRLCCSGMRWTPEGAQIILSLRALVLTDTRWQQFWQKITSREFLKYPYINYWPHPVNGVVQCLA
jgi:hypothetical protein